MTKVTLSDVANISGAESAAIGVLNANSDLITTAIENTLSRDGTTPNSMAADLDMDNNDILNVDNIDVNTLTIDGSPVFPEDLVTTDPDAFLAIIGGSEAGIDGFKFDFDTFALMKADILRTYSNTVVGDYIRTRSEGFAYEVAASDASDHHVTTVGGLKLYVLLTDGAYNVKAFGAVGDFDSATGIGTDDRAAIQKTYDAAIALDGGCAVFYPSGHYYFGTGYGVYSSLGVCTNLGTTTPGSAKNIDIIGEGATLYQGAPGRLLAIMGADRVTVRGLKIIGYTGGTLAATRQNDAGITITYNSKNVTIEDNYITNSLGDCVYVGGSLVSGGETGYESRNITIRHNTLKERYGDGTRSYSSGTRSRLAVATIDCVGLKIHDNEIYGGVDLEVNIDGQHLIDVSVENNQFKSGHVTAQASIGTDYWHDEPINLTGGTVIDQTVTITGVAASPVVERCVVESNTFEYGVITDSNVYKFDRVTGNLFQYGQIRSGMTSGPNSSFYRNIIENTALNPITGETTFVRLDGLLYYGNISENRAEVGFTYCVNNNGASTGDGGRCTFANNTLGSGTAVVGLTLQLTSVEFGSIKTGTGGQNAAKSSMLQSGAFFSPLVSTSAYATGSYSIDWDSYRGASIFVTHTGSGQTVSITDITSELGDGHEVTIISGGSGGGTTVLVYAAGLIRTKGAVNASIAANECVTLVNRSGIWFEKSRSF